VIGYAPDGATTSGIFGDCSVLRGVTNGSKHIKVPMPWLSMLDHMPICDILADHVDPAYISCSDLSATFFILSTMLDVVPTLQVAVFMSAGDDFEYLQPYAVGLNDVESSGAALRPQCDLPAEDETFETRARSLKTTNSMIALSTVEDIMSAWSRALPYADYDDSDEPVPDMLYASSPMWWPLNSDFQAAYTLDVNNSWYCTNDFVSLFSSQFLFYRGSIGMKICCLDLPGIEGYKYVSLVPDIEPVIVLRQQTHSPFTEDGRQLPSNANLGNGVVITPSGLQPVLDLTYPFISSMEWANVNRIPTAVGFGSHYFSSYVYPDVVSVSSNITLIDEGDLSDALYRKAGSDYGLAIETLLPPPTLWLARGFHWENSFASKKSSTRVSRPPARMRADYGRKEQITSPGKTRSRTPKRSKTPIVRGETPQ